MNCFSIFERAILQKCYPSKESVIDQTNEIEEPETQPKTTSPMPQESEPFSCVRKSNKKDAVDLDGLLKAIEPRYKAPKTVDLIVLTKGIDINGERRSSAKTRFDLEDAEFEDLGDEPEDIKLG